jgi:protein-S-isoprenylcysteine O-methyltransferase Ste14
MTLLSHDPAARRLLIATAVAVVAGELVASYLGHARDGQRSLIGSLWRGRGPAVRQDRGTRLVFGAAAYLGIAAAVGIARVPDLRDYANNWWTFGLGIAIVLFGAAFRDWSIVSLGRWFRREVTIEPGQRLVRRGPYRVLRHPSYTGLILVFAGFGLAIGSWVGAAAALVVVLAGLVPRIRVEERALANTFGAEYTEYAGSTARLLPHVW